MNQPSDTPNETETIKSEIASTREQMDGTIDALTERLKGRHLIDEAIGFFRSKTSEGDASDIKEKASQIKEKISSTTGSAISGVVDAVKSNPVPALLVGAGLAWWIYSSRKGSRRSSASSDRGDYDYASNFYDEDLGYDTPFDGPAYDPSHLEFPDADETAGQSGQAGLADKAEGIKDKVSEKASQVKDQLQEKASGLTSRARQGARQVKQRASQLTGKAQQQAKQIYTRGREKAVSTVDAHPLEVGIACLAAGIVVGLVVPTPDRVTDAVAPTANRLRRRAREAGRDLVNRGKHVVEAATNAVKEEVQAQGLTPDALTEKASAVANKAKQAATDTAQREGLVPGEQPAQAPSTGSPAGQPAAKATPDF